MSDTERMKVSKCQNLKALDKKYGTEKRSPLHHNKRCPCMNKASE